MQVDTCEAASLFNVADERLLMTLRNDSLVETDFEVFSEGIGLQGVRERLDSLGGTMRLEPLVDGFEMLTINTCSPRACNSCFRALATGKSR